ncbi:hypothetical protein BSL78_03394 [Apostichopus japonicus]|uniref:Protein FAM227B n=1 Tax=Stichopus japonicus TaxID=307972 RepID=A0A2G8LHD8_STIJA|nr:hypothetical protein BSL78_03394 [Apostichopus japonicus]
MFASSLVIESQGSNFDDDDYFYPSQDTYGPVKARDVKELNQFAGIYSVKSTLTADQTNKGKYLAKRIKTSKMKKKETKATKPKLVELYQFRGFDNKKLTPLPDLDSAITILMRVTDAQRSLDKKPHYKEEFKRLFHSKMSEAVLIDSFWWFFLNRYHPSKMVQPKLFNRIAHNYVKLLLSANHPKYRDVFFQGYADLLAQGMYAAFCAAFPDSWRQFQGISSVEYAT